MKGLRQDFRGAFRVFGREPGFVTAVVATLAIGIGGATAVFSVIRGVLLTPMAFEHSERVVMLWGQTSEYPRAPLTVGDYNELARNVRAFDGVAASWSNTTLLLGGARAEQVSLAWVTPSYFDVLGVGIELGRVPAAGEESAVVLSHELWVRRYGSDPSVIGRIIDLGGDPFEVVGVIAADQNPNLTSFARRQTNHDMWRLQPAQWTTGDDRSVGWLRTTARLREGTGLQQAQSEVNALMQQVNAAVTDRDGGTDLRVNLIPARADLVGGISQTLWILLGAVCGVLLIAAANVAHLMLARGQARTGEVAVRAALGGSRVRLVRQFLLESAVLAAVGGVSGLLVAWAGVRTLLAVAPATIPRLDLVRVDGGVALFAIVATTITAAVFGIIPAVRSTRYDLARVMTQRGATMDRGAHRMSRALVVIQVALSLALVSGTGLLLQSLRGLHEIDLGFTTSGTLTFALDAVDWGDGNEAAAARLRTFADQLAAVPGVQDVGFTNRVPLAGGLFTGRFASETMANDNQAIEAAFRFITPGYLEAMGARLVMGRVFRPEDGMESVLVDETAAKLAWPGESPVGRRVRITSLGDDPMWAEVIGVVAPMKHEGVATPATETVFLPMYARAWQQNFRYAAVRVAGDPLAALESIRNAVQSVDVNAVVARPRSMRSLFDDHVAPTRFATLLLLVFGGVALLLATVGLHGVMAYTVRRRIRELRIRMALGANRAHILRGVFASGISLVVAGIAAGIAVSLLGVGKILESLLVGVGQADLVTLGGSACVILLAGTIGAYLPARFVLGMDPANALREE